MGDDNLVVIRKRRAKGFDIDLASRKIRTEAARGRQCRINVCDRSHAVDGELRKRLHAHRRSKPRYALKQCGVFRIAGESELHLTQVLIDAAIQWKRFINRYQLARDLLENAPMKPQTNKIGRAHV